MSVRRSSIVLAAVGLVFVVSAVLTRLVVIPIVTKLPGDTDQTVHYAGTATLLNSSALQSGDTAHVINSNVPVTADRRLKVTGTYGDTAIVQDALTVHEGTQNLPPSTYTYAINRSTLLGTTPPAGISVEPSTGAISSAFPRNANTTDSFYTFYDPTTRLIVPVHYSGATVRGGRSVNLLSIDASGAVKSPTVLASLPSALPKTLLASLAPLLPASLKAELTPAAVAALPPDVPLTYTGTTSIVAAVDKQTGIAINETISEQIVMGVTLGTQHVAVMPVLAFDLHLTPASATYLANEATTASELLTLISVVAPITLLVLGVVLILVAFLRRRKPRLPAHATSGTDIDTGYHVT